MCPLLVVTGGSRGIGAAVSEFRRLASNECRVADRAQEESVRAISLRS